MKKEAKQGAEESALSRIFSWAFLIINILFGILTAFLFIYGLLLQMYLIGFLYLLLAVFLFMPRRVLNIKRWAKFLIALVCLVVIVIISASFYWQVPVYSDNSLNEKFILESSVGNISMLVYNTSKTDSMMVNNQQKSTAGYFLLVNVELTNLANSAINLNPSCDIIDAQNKTYIGLGSNGLESSFQPNLPKSAYFVFEMPNSAAGLKFRISDLIGIHRVDLEI